MSGVGVATTGDFYGPDAGATMDQQFTQNAPMAQNTTVGALSRDGGDSKPAMRSHDMAPGLRGMNPLLWIPLILGTIVIVRVLREWGEKDGEVKEARAGLYFGVMASLWTVALVPLYKALLTKYHINGLSEYVQNA
ncbi:MAG: hypothetical protein NVSMB19_15860 [Vulcanimicrobiaceae bacterium]